MKRIIVDYTKVTDEILNIILEEYPDGYRDQDVIKFKNHKNELIEALEIRLGEDIYLVKVGTKLDQAIVNFAEENIDEVAMPDVALEDDINDDDDDDEEDSDKDADLDEDEEDDE